jgi:hypothetical protein
VSRQFRWFEKESASALVAEVVTVDTTVCAIIVVATFDMKLGQQTR